VARERLAALADAELRAVGPGRAGKRSTMFLNVVSALVIGVWSRSDVVYCAR
jgi:hypothetical protein